MGLFKIFKTPNPNQYNYIPRYWDPAKEEKKARLRYLESLTKENSDIEEIKSRMSINLRKKSFVNNPSVRKKAVYKSNMILFSTIIILFLLAYIILYVNLPEILNYLK